MVEKKITRKLISKRAVEKKEEPVEQTETTEVQKEVKSKRVCYFCQNKQNPSYTDTNLLRRFITDRAKIVPKTKNNLCSKHQRRVSRQIKYARHLSLLPFTPKV